MPKVIKEQRSSSQQGRCLQDIAYFPHIANMLETGKIPRGKSSQPISFYVDIQQGKCEGNWAWKSKSVWF